jgi:predicted permease
MRTIWQDIRYGFRMLARNPGFSAIVILILAVGIGATMAVLSVVDAVLLRPPPYPDPGSLVTLYQGKADDETNRDWTSRNWTSYANFVDWRDQSTVFDQMAGVSTSSFMATTKTRRELVLALPVSLEYFSLLGVKPALGRLFLTEETRAGSELVVIISDGFWHNWFGGDPNVVGKTLILDNRIYTVIGVLPADFRYVEHERQVWLPLVPCLHDCWGVDLASRNGTIMKVMARLKPGVTMTQAQAQMNLIGQRLAQVYPNANAGTTVRVVPIVDEYRAQMGHSRSVLLIAQAIVAFILLVACLHVGGLLLIRSVTREKEIAVRAALGAGCLRLVRQLLTEGVLLALAGGLLGLLLVHWGLGLVEALRAGPDSWNLAKQIQRFIPWFVELHVKGRTFFYAIGVSLVTSVFFGILPAILGSQINLNQCLSQGRAPGRGLRFQRIRSTLVIVDIAMAFVLLIGAGLLVNTYLRLSTGLGYDPENVLTMEPDLNENQPPYSLYEQRLAFYEQILERVRGLPGVEYAAVADTTPSWGGGNFHRLGIEGFSPAQYSEQDEPRFPNIRWRQVSPDYFRALKIPLLKGRDFTPDDRVGTSPAIIVSEPMARRFWPHENPVGKYITDMTLYIRNLKEPTGGEGKKQVIPVQYQVVGVVGDARQFTFLEPGPGDLVVYTSYAQTEWGGTMPLMVRASSDPQGLIGALRRIVQDVDGQVEIRKTMLLEDEIAELLVSQRFNMFFLSGFAAVVLVLVAMGLYGIIAYAVSQRTREIGIRIALGAHSGDVLRAVLRQGFKITLVGVVVGLGSALAATRIIASLLYNVSPTDPLTFVCVSLLLVVVNLLATYIPARRAAKIDPMEALRYE